MRCWELGVGCWVLGVELLNCWMIGPLQVPR